MDLQQLANETNKKVYLYRMSDRTIDYSFEKLRCGDLLNGKHILELCGAFVPQKENHENRR